jgi:hypothetical protein
VSDLSVNLPEHGDGSRRDRRPVRARRRVRRGPLLAAAGFVVAIALVIGVLSTFRGSDGDGAPRAVATTVPSGGRSTLLLHHDGTGALAGATLVVVSPSGGGTLLHIPPVTMAEAPALGLAPLRDAAAAGTASALVTVENLLGGTIDVVQRVDPLGWSAAVRPAGSVTVDVPSAVRRGDRVAFPAGEVQVGADAVSDLLALPASTDLQRLVRVQAFWDAWLSAVRKDPALAPPPSVLGVDVRRLARGTVTHVVLPVDPLGGADELYKVDAARLDAQIRRVLPDALPRDARVAVQVLNGTGAPGTVAAALPALVRAGARMAVSGNADRFDHKVTQIVYYDEADAARAQRLRKALGFGQVVRSRARLDAVTLTVVVGPDFAASSGGTSSADEGASP